MDGGPAKGRGTAPTPKNLTANTTGVNSPSQSESGYGNLLHRGYSPAAAQSTSQPKNSPDTMQGNGGVLGAPLRMTPNPAKHHNAEAAQNYKMQPSASADTPQPQGTKRTASRMGGYETSKNQGDVEGTASDDDKNGSQSARKRIRMENEEEERIGCHIDAHELAVYASYKNALHLRIHPDEVTAEISEKFLGKIGRVVTIEKVVLDAEIFGRTAEELEAMTSEQKKVLVKSHLKSMESGVASKEVVVKTETDNSESEGLLVGYRTDDPDPALNNIKIPVYASLNNNKIAPALKFRLGKKEAMESKIQLEHQSTPHFSQITFISPFDRGDEKATKDFIKGIIHGIEIVPNQKGDSVTQELRQALQAHKLSGEVLASKIDNFIVSRDNSGLEEKIKKDAKIKSLVEENKAQAADIERLEEDNDARAADIVRLEAENYAQDSTLNNQTSQITEKDHKIESLEERVKQLTAQVEQLTRSTKCQQYDNLIIEDQIFNKFPPGDENDGLYVTKQPRVVTVDGSEYHERTALSEFKNVNLGGDLTESVELDGIPFKLISGGKYSGKLVQDLGPHSVFEHKGKFFVRWFIRTKKELSL